MGAFDGAFLYMHDLASCDGGDPAAIVARLTAHGAAGVFIKVTDGNHGYNDWNAVGALVAALRAAGLGVVTWGYNYGYDPAGEANAAIDAIRQFAPDAHLFDTEIEMETLADPVGVATQLVSTVKAAVPAVPLGYAPVSNIQGHLRCPYRQFTDAGCAMVPQTYYVAYGWTPTYTLQSFYASANQYELETQPIFPTYEDSPLGGYPSTAEQLMEFLAQLPANVTGVSVWVYDLLDGLGWARFDRVAAKFPRTVVVPPPVPDPEVARLEAEVALLTSSLADETQVAMLAEAKIAAALTALDAVPAPAGGGQ